MSPEAKELLGQKLEQLAPYGDEQEIAINARDLRAFGFQIPAETPDSVPVALRVKDLRQVAASADVAPVVEDCGCPEKE
jgi:hypothetical protein